MNNEQNEMRKIITIIIEKKITFQRSLINKFVQHGTKPRKVKA